MIIDKELNNIGELIDFSSRPNQNKDIPPRRHYYTFRGQKNYNYTLESSLKRLVKERNIELFEKRLLENFKKYAQILEPRVCGSIWETMVLAQHHGVPTRLLDFSLSPLVALHFALNGDTYEETPVVWAVGHSETHKVLPSKYLQKKDESFSVSFTVEMLNELGLSINDYSRDMGSHSMLFLEPPSIDDRIVNQFSHFALLPTDLDPMDDFLKCSKEITAYRFIIPPERANLFRIQLDTMNITDRILFPGLDGIASYLRKRYYTRY